MTKTEAFSQFGAKLTNPQWSWSARTTDAVVLTLWKDKFRWEPKPGSYDGTHEPGDENLRGNKERLENLRWSRDNCNGRIKVVMAVKVAEASGARRKIEDCFAAPNLTMRLTHLNEKTGEFRAEIVETA